MKKLYSAIASVLLLLSGITNSSAQCDGIRYHDSIFTAFTLTSDIVYGNNLKTNYNYVGTAFPLKLDVYEPSGDVLPLRPLVIVAHGGSFIGGSKIGNDVTPLCKDLTQLGYVTASIEYRTGMTNFPFTSSSHPHTVDSTDAGASVMRAVHDARAAVRFFRKNARVGGNTYRIDTNNIYFAGVSAGGFMALHLVYMDLLSEFPSYVDTLAQPGLGGGLEGLSGNQGYPSNVKAIINICGALGHVSWMQAGDEPVLNFHGTVDKTVPYGTALIYLQPPSSYPLLKVDGSHSVAQRASNLNIESCMVTWFGQDHVPEVSNASYYDSMFVTTANWLEHQQCGVSLTCQAIPAIGISEQTLNADQINVFPNPANSSFTLDLKSIPHKELQINIYDNLGKKVKNIKTFGGDQITIPRDDLKSGIYMISVISEGNNYTKKVILE
jgi:para-nitrobenzyl esterase